jgi:hypothetical protein
MPLYALKDFKYSETHWLGYWCFNFRVIDDFCYKFRAIIKFTLANLLWQLPLFPRRCSFDG